MADKIERAEVTAPTYINGVLHMPGEIAQVNLTELGVSKLGATRKVKGDNGNDIEVELTPGLKAVSGTTTSDDLAQIEIAAVAPHAPNPTAPQGLPPGSVPSGTGRNLSPAASEEDGMAAEATAPTTEAPKKK